MPDRSIACNAVVPSSTSNAISACLSGNAHATSTRSSLIFRSPVTGRRSQSSWIPVSAGMYLPGTGHESLYQRICYALENRPNKFFQDAAGKFVA